MPPAYEVLLLNTAIPQIQAAQSGDTYVVPRDIAINATAIISANSATDALRITQTGAGNAILVEDSANPDSTPFVVTAAGDVGIGTTSTSSARLSIGGTLGTIVTATRAVQIADSAGGALFIGKDNSDYSYLIHDAAAQTSNWFYRGAVGLTMSNVGNFGLGVTPSTWFSGTKAVEIGATTALMDISGQTNLYQNAYLNAAGNLIYKENGQATQYRAISGQHQWHTSGTVAGSQGAVISNMSQAMTLDASGNLLVGGTGNDPFGRGFTGTRVVFGNNIGETGLTLQSGTGTSSFFEFGTNTTRLFSLSGNASAGTSIKTVTAVPLTFGTGDTERVRITSGGDLLIGSQTDVAQRVRIEYDNVSPQWGMKMHSTATSGDNNFIEFGTEAVFQPRGSITYNRAGGAIAYNTTSDYRAKDIIGLVQNSGQIIDALKVYTGKMKGATIERPMLVAHEAQEHVPYAVTGEKDAVNEDGTPKYQQMDVSSLVPLLLAEIQSLRARVAQLEAK